MDASQNAKALLQWYVDAGADEAIGDVPVDRLRVLEKTEPPAPATILPIAPAAPATPAPAATSVPAAVASSVIAVAEEAEALARAANNLDELRQSLENFQGLGLRRSATHTVFSDGFAKAPVMLVGDVPGADEDRAGLPFAGEAGILLDRMLGAIGLTREENAYITMVINWRPPGGREPSAGEVAASLPFLHRHIELVQPKVLVLVGGFAAKAVLKTTRNVMALRGKWHAYESAGLKGSLPAMALYHPAYLMGSPTEKAAAWQDLLMLKAKLEEN